MNKTLIGVLSSLTFLLAIFIFEKLNFFKYIGLKFWTYYLLFLLAFSIIEFIIWGCILKKIKPIKTIWTGSLIGLIIQLSYLYYTMLITYFNTMEPFKLIKILISAVPLIMIKALINSIITIKK